ncbi:RmlC-like cupin domain-containing protein [Xylariaceae sp. FL1651]|nr:RmlC-like cupin domain-containing protein [Xylariaceae sp. FL1651]
MAQDVFLVTKSFLKLWNGDQCREGYNGLVVLEGDDRDLKASLIPKLMAAKDRFDDALAGPLKSYFLRANTGPKWMLGGVTSRPFTTAPQCDNKFAISSIESSSLYGDASFSSSWLTFATVDHCFSIMEGLLKIRMKGKDDSFDTLREGQTAVVAAGQGLLSGTVSSYSGVVLPDTPGAVEQPRFRKMCEELGVQVEAADFV